MRQMQRWLIQVTIVLVLLATAAPALAHRPYFEENDITADKPWRVDDPTISTALYATLDSTEDVDYFAFNGRTGQSILLSIVIPQITGQEDFAPVMALFGPGLPAGDVPGRVARADGTGVLQLEPPREATTFFEPFSRTSYWNRQEQRVTLPADGRYTVAVWHDDGRAGRYVFVIGDKELPGGDMGFAFKMKSYWTPLVQLAPAPSRPVCGDWMK
jgi:hypothetical protein